ncbi:hypothetical protein VTL71DRAFT_16165 [Oculimacula yallundae]|uniref:NADAR domain-containing protein n=1 Tax=Oculimacula yallundae TaxID=86028 RepID=A0ABR4CEE2_9HELO
MRPHQRPKKATRGHPGNTSSEIEDPNFPIFFYMPNDHPYSLFCQWKSTSFTVPRESLTWLRIAHPGHADISSNPTEPPNVASAPTNLSFNCAEQFMMFCKALYFHHKHSANLIMSTTSPSLQKKYGRAIPDFQDFLWRQSCERVAFEGNWWKFARNEARRNFLLGTGEKMLCEASSMDRRWGIGYKENHAMRYRGNWGENLLGKAIMRVRQKVRERLKEMEFEGRNAEDWELPGKEMWVANDEGITTARQESR